MTDTSMKSSRIIGLQFSLLSPDEIRKGSVANIVSRDTYVNNKPVIGGLFDPRMGVLEPGLICPTDGHNYMKTPGYFGHIELARPVFYIQYLNTILKILRCVCIKCSKLLISKNKHKHILEKMDARHRWLYVFPIASKISRCGDDTCDGCGCKQPKKIMKEGLATIIAEWSNVDNIADDEGNIKDKLTMKLTPEIVLKIFRRISDEDVSFMGFSPTFSRPDWMVCQVLAVPPPSIRPSVKHDAQQRSEDDISHIIVNIIKANNTLSDKLKQNATSKVIDDWTTVLQYYCATMIDNRIPGVASVAQRSGRALKSIKERLVGKTGRVRGNLMGKRVDFSARSVITPDPNISIGQLGVPKKVAMNITYPVTVNKRNKQFLTTLILNGPDKYPGAKILERASGDSISLRYTDRESIELMDGDVVHRHLMDGDAVLFNRQPTLHRMSMMSHFVKVLHTGSTFRLNVAVTKPYNADFDGDEMNLHGPQDDESSAELRLLAAVRRQIISPASNKSIIGIFQDSLLGSFRLTRPDIKFDSRTAMNLLMSVKNVNPKLLKNPNKEISSFELLSQIIPPMSAHFKNGQNSDDKNNIIDITSGKYSKGQLDKSALGSGKGLIQNIFNDFGYQSASDFIDNLQNIVTDYMKLSSYSVGISDLISNNITNKRIADSIVAKKKIVSDLINDTHIGTFENNTGKTNEMEFESRVNAQLTAALNEAGKIGRNSLSKDNRFVIMVGSGSKGSNLNIAQMISCLGQQNVDGKRIPYGFENRTLPHYKKFDDSPEARGFVESSFIQGLTPEELFFHAMGGRVGLIDTAVKTSQTGYIQRRLIKSLEDLKMCYDGTVRNNKNKIIQFSYGDDNIDPTKVENQKMPLPEMTIEDIYSHFQIPNDESSDDVSTVNYTKAALKRMKGQKQELITETQGIIDYMLEARENLVKHVFNYSDNTTIHIPVNFRRIITNIAEQLKYQKNSMVNITPLETYNLLKDNFATLETLGFGSPSKLFEIAYYYYLSPKQLLSIHRFNRKGLEVLCAKINSVYKNALCNPGEMVGLVAAQSIGEPTTQMSQNKDAMKKIIKVSKDGSITHTSVKIGDLCDDFIHKYPEYTFPTGHPDSVETLLDKLDDEYYIVGVNENEKTSWSRISHFSRHPVNGDMMTVRTRSGRKVSTTLSHSHLIRKDQKVKPIRGSDLMLGMRIPVCKEIDNTFVSKSVTVGDDTFVLDALFGWFIGAYLAEGNCNGNKIQITNISEHFIRKTTEFASKLSCIATTVHRKKGEKQFGDSSTTSFTHKEFAKFLVSECGDNSFTKKVPDFMFVAPLECKGAMIQGYMDGDGNINCDKNHHEIRACSRSKQLMKDMGLMFNYFGIFTTFRENERQEKPLYHIAISNAYVRQYKEHIGSTLKIDKLEELYNYATRDNSHSLSNDIDKIEGLGDIIAKCGKTLKLPGQSRDYGSWKNKASIGRRTLQKYINTFMDAIGEQPILEEEMRILHQAANSNIIWDEIVEIDIYTPDQREYVYDFTVPANQTFMEDNGVIVHNTLNTFHFAGVASKSNVTRGVPRIEEILSLSENPKQPSTTIYLKEEESTDNVRAQEIKYTLEYTSLRDITTSVSICFDPDDLQTLINEDKPLMEEYSQFSSLISECVGASDFNEEEDDTKSKWIIRFELDREAMLDKNINMDDVHFAIQHSHKDEISCIYSDFNADKLVLRVRLDKSLINSKKKSLDQSDEIYKLKNLQLNLLDNIILRGIKKIPKVLLRKSVNQLKMVDGNYEKEDIWVLDTVGTNFHDILTLKNIMADKTYSNDIQEVYRTLGIEAARQCVFNELEEAFEDASYINYHHLSILCDRICATKKMVSVFRHGINNDDIGPIAKASFEETPEMFLRAARHAELDLMTGVSANVMCGQEGYFGTGFFQVMLDINEMAKLGTKDLEDEVDIDDMLIDKEKGTCSVDNITIGGNTTLINGVDTGKVDDEYDPGF
jgi:DNA-directed RNA polymerase beta' subunit